MSTFRLAELAPIARATRAPAFAGRPTLTGPRDLARRPNLAGPSAAPIAAPATTPTDDEVRRAVAAVLPDALRARAYDELTYSFVARLARVAPADVGHCYPTKAQLVLSALRPLPRRTPERAAFESS